MRPSSPSMPGSIGRYEVLSRLGQGAMGRVVLANDPVLDRSVAIKLLRDDLGLPEAHRQQLFERMRQEARASARISHPNIVALFDMGEDAALGLYLVFEYVKGSTLKAQIGAAPMAPEAAATLARELGSALRTAHDAGVLHRDIKPENVILSPTGAKIADFGIARLPESTLTRDGRLLGTPAYSSPESVSHGRFSPASDQFSLAATLYEAIGQERAFPGDDAVAVATLITTTEPLPIAERLGLLPGVDRVLLRGLSKEPRERFANCEEFGLALAEALTNGRSDAFRASATAAAAGRPSRDRDVGSRTVRVIVGAATLGALLMAGLLHATRSCQTPVTSDTDDAAARLEALGSSTSAPMVSTKPPRVPARRASRAESMPASTRQSLPTVPPPN